MGLEGYVPQSSLVSPSQVARILEALGPLGDDGYDLFAYLAFGSPPPPFLEAVLINDLELAWHRGTEEYRRNLGLYVQVLRDADLHDAWGDLARVSAWVDRGLMLRLQHWQETTRH